MRVNMAGSVVVLATMLLSTFGIAQAATFTDTDVLNFALNLECLEAEFYSWAAYGKSLADVEPALTGGNNLTTTSSGGIASSGFSAAALAYAQEVAENEVEHVRFLRLALGSKAVACPSLSLSPATFTSAAILAVGGASKLAAGTSNTAFNPYLIEDHFWLAAFIFEDVGVTAYTGAVSVLADATLAATAAGIGAVEAGHAAVVRYQLYELANNDTGLETSAYEPITYGEAVSAITALRDTLGGTTASTKESPLIETTVASYGPSSSSGPVLFATDSNAVAYTRTPKQVLNIVTFGDSNYKGGFFPSGVNASTALITGSPADKRCTASS